MCSKHLGGFIPQSFERWGRKGSELLYGSFKPNGICNFLARKNIVVISRFESDIFVFVSLGITNLFVFLAKT